MTDREMLELAAKAYGFGDKNGSGNLVWLECEYPRDSKNNGALWNYMGWDDTPQLFNSLTEERDALRLAVKLGFIVDIDIDEHVTNVDFTSNSEDFTLLEGHGLNPMEATCRAITRAAALVGKEMK